MTNWVLESVGRSLIGWPEAANGKFPELHGEVSGAAAIDQYQMNLWVRLRLKCPEILADAIIPSARPLTPEQQARESQKLKDTQSFWDAKLSSWEQWDAQTQRLVLEQAKWLVESEVSSLESVHSRLNTTVGMASVSISIAFAVLGMLFSELSGRSPRLWIGGLMLVALYVAFQLVVAAFAAIKGLARTGYRHLTVADVLPGDSEDDSAVESRIVAVNFSRHQTLRESVNRSVTQMAIAHTALRNACVGVAATVLLVSVSILFQPHANNDHLIEQKIINRIRSDRDLSDFLRGPDGPRGERGIQGEPYPLRTATEALENHDHPSKERVSPARPE